MAAVSPRKRLKEEAMCSVCLDFFTDPVTLECGHNFCQGCIDSFWGSARADDSSCPQCCEIVLQRSLKLNRQLANMVAIAKELSTQPRLEGGWQICEWHQEPLKLFCQDDKAPICVVCDRSKEHRGHNMVPLQEAAQECKDKISSCLESLREKKERILSYKADTEKECQELLNQTNAEREKTVTAFREFHQFLEEQEKYLLAQVEEVEKEISVKSKEHLASLSKELSSLESLIQEMEEKQQQPTSELLQDIGCLLQRYEKKKKAENQLKMTRDPRAFPLELKWKIWDFCDINLFLEGLMKQLRDGLIDGLQLQQANVMLDPKTAHPQLILSEDRKTASVGKEARGLLTNPERFDKWQFVLGREEFTSGRHFWEITVEGEGEWSVGVAKKSVRRKGEIECGPQEGIWDIGKWDGRYCTSAPPFEFPVSSGELLKQIRVSLNCTGKQLAFYNVDTAALLFVYSELQFSGQTLLPFFWLNDKVHLILSP